MWYEILKICRNNFNITRNLGDLYYSVVDKNNTTLIANKVVKWFSNGFILTRNDFHVHAESRDGVDLSYNYYVFDIYNNQLKGIFSFETRTKDHNKLVDDFINEYLIITISSSIEFGVIDNQGKKILPFCFTC